ncbi:FAD-binding oxidoreductase, partial [Candidatus Uhrbacteria bacterium]|nr:FAD-binding oxidoreductase [Candidatus Uhrbacteria bacterium]
MTLAEDIGKFFKGEVSEDSSILESYSRDASLFKVRPKLVVYPKDAEDLKNLVRWLRDHPSHSVTVRAGGSDMSGGPLGESIIADVTRHLNHIREITEQSVWTEPGVFYRDFEKQTLASGLILPCFPASKDLCALGGMIANNCAGEKTLRYGKMENFVLESKMIFSDGREYAVKPLSRALLERKMAQGDFEGDLYKNLFALIEHHKAIIEQARPRVSKNSAGYYLWNVCSTAPGTEEFVFDLNKLIAGSQGTLAIVTEAKVRLVPPKPHHDLVAMFLESWAELPSIVNAILPYDPESLETFDEETLKLGIRFMPEIAKRAHSSLFSLAARFIPEAIIGARMLGLPKLVVLVEIAEETEAETKSKVRQVIEALKPFNVYLRVIAKDSEEDKFWIMRRESFNLLR